MRRTIFSLLAASMLVLALSAPAPAARKTSFALAGEARALELGLGDQGATLGLALSRADSTPRALGVGAGQCALLGEDPDPSELPCAEENTEQSHYPGQPGDEAPSCAATLPAPLNQVVTLQIACGSSQSGLTAGLPFTKNEGRVGRLSATTPVNAVLEIPGEVDRVAKDLTNALGPVLNETPKQVRDAVDQVLDLVEGLDATDVLQAEIGPARSDIMPAGAKLKVQSTAAGALIGILGIPAVDSSGAPIPATANPLENGLVIIEVGTASASASVDEGTTSSAGEASAALVTVKVRDVTKPEPTYITISVAPGETVTVLQGTPAESTITAATSSTQEKGDSAVAAADAVRLHLLKGVQGGLKVGLARATAAANVDSIEAAPPKPPAPEEKPPRILPTTGGQELRWVALALLVAAGAALALRSRLGDG